MIFPRMRVRHWVLAACVFVSPTLTSAQTYLDEGFQDGDADGWQSDAGKGKIGLTTYAGNISLKMTRDAYAVRRFENIDSARVRISAVFAADKLEGADACILEASPDGATWFEIGRIGDGQDDALTLHPVTRVLDIESSQLYLGARISGNASNDTCWVDNISVVGMRRIADLPTSLDEDVLWASVMMTDPVSTQAFTPPEQALAPLNSYSGMLKFKSAKAVRFELLKDAFNYAPMADRLDHLPELEMGFVHDGTDLIPAQRGPQPNSHPDWEWIIEPGKIWRLGEGRVRAAVPFALQERNANCLHNGVLAFEISPDGEVSDMIYQIGSETCAYLQFNLWGSAPVSFDLSTHPRAEKLIGDYQSEVAHRLPTRPLSDLDFRDQLGHSEEVAADAITALGYVKNGEHFTAPCPTRFGDYPFCDVLDLPSYSWAKSMVAGMGSMRLEKLYSGAMNSLISDYVPACRDWKDVTFQHALDMATGYYESDVYDEDEASEGTRQFFLADRHDQKIDLACTLYDRQSEPGTTFVYHTTDTYILGTAITAFLREKTGRDDANIFDELIRPLWNAIGMSPVSRQTRRTYDEVGQVFSGWGLTLHRDDIAKVATFLHDGGQIDGEAMLDPDMLSEALQKPHIPVGLKAVIANQRYKNGFWAWNAGPSLGCDTDLFIPAMSGYGGLTLALLPNGHTYYYISDGHAFAWARAAKASHGDTPLCEISP